MKFIKLGTVCKLRNGYAFKSSAFADKGVPIIRISNINENLVTPEKAVRIAYDKIFDSYKIAKGDILIAMSGATTGKFGIYSSDEIAYQNQRVGCFQILDDDLLNRTYLLQVLKIVKPIIEKKANGGAQPNISASGIEEMIIPLPSLEDQIRIAEILTQAEKLITQREESIVMLDELLKSTFLEMFGDPIANSKKLPTLKGRELFKFTSGKFNPKQNLSVDYKFPCYGGNGVTGYSNKYLIDYPTLIIGRVGAYCGNVHLVKEFCWITDNAIYIKEILKPQNLQFLYYLFFYLKLNRFADVAGQPKITQAPLEDLLFLDVPIELQNQFSKVVEKVDSLKTEYQKSLIELENMYGVLSQNAFKGELIESEESGEVKKKSDNVMENEPDEIIDIKDYTQNKKEKVDITNMTFADYVEFPEEFQIRDEKWMSMFLGQNEFYQFLLKDTFKDVSFNLFDIETKLHDFFYHGLDMDFDNEQCVIFPKKRNI